MSETQNPVPDPVPDPVAAPPVVNPPYVPPPGASDTPPPVPTDDPNMDPETKAWIDAHQKPADPRDPATAELTHSEMNPPSTAPDEPPAEGDPF